MTRRPLRYDQRDKVAMGARAFNKARKAGEIPSARPTILLTHAQQGPDSEGCIGRIVVPMEGILLRGAVSIQRTAEGGKKPPYKVLFKVIEDETEKTWSFDSVKNMFLEELNWGISNSVLEVYLEAENLELFKNPSLSFVFEPR